MKTTSSWMDNKGNLRPDLNSKQEDLEKRLKREQEAYNNCFDEHARPYHLKRIKEIQSKIDRR